MMSFNYTKNRNPFLLKLNVCITGASGTLGKSLLKHFHERGAHVIGLTSSHENPEIFDRQGRMIPIKWITWKCGEEQKLVSFLKEIDLLIINHGVNFFTEGCIDIVSIFLNVNAISSTRILNMQINQEGWYREIWINTSEAEIQPALSPLYEISKRLIGQVISLYKYNFCSLPGTRIRKLVLGPFKSKLNPIGIMSPDFVVRHLIYQANLGLGLIIITPNLLTYILMPIVELTRWIYYKSLFQKLKV